MNLYLIRHAEAVPLGEQGITEDALRPLTPEGERQAAVVGKGLKARGIRLDKLVTSPLVRARQTVEILLRHWTGHAPEVMVSEALIPDVRPKKLARFLRNLDAEHIGLVGHNPQFNIIASWLIGSKKAQIDIAKAGVAYIPCENSAGRGLGTLEWLVTPEWLE